MLTISHRREKKEKRKRGKSLISPKGLLKLLEKKKITKCFYKLRLEWNGAGPWEKK